MSRNNQNTGREADMDFSALDLELARMAGETPDVPEDFHRQWMQAIRQEASSAAGQQTERKTTDARKQRRYILSAAAAFVLVIGGALLLKDRQDSVMNRMTHPTATTVREEATVAPADETEIPGTVEETDEATEDSASETGAALKSESASYAESESYADMEEAAEAAYDAYDAAVLSADMGMTEDSAAAESYSGGFLNSLAAISGTTAYGTAAAGEEARESNAALSSEKAAAKAETAETYMEAEADMAAEEAAFMTEAEAEEEQAAVSEPDPAPTAAPAPAPETAETAAAKAEQETPETKAASEAEPETEEAEEAPSFLQNVWDTLLNITPWVIGIVGVALFLITYVLRYKQGKRK